jgi:sulfite reductase beta subunit-like hemoprotein
MHRGEFRLTANQNLVIAGVPASASANASTRW